MEAPRSVFGIWRRRLIAASVLTAFEGTAAFCTKAPPWEEDLHYFHESQGAVYEMM